MSELQEKDFIHEPKDPFSFWFWFIFIVVISSLLWAAQSWYYKWIADQRDENPFLQVTNRDLSVFLWQFPEHMRVNAKQKTGYLTAFQYHDKITVEPLLADKYVEAPPELLFLYHTWDRLLKNEFIETAIPRNEFIEFLNYAEEWKPQYWPEAPRRYAAFVSDLKQNAMDDLSKASEEQLPKKVRQAFQGWKNYFIDGDAINSIELSYEQIEMFLKHHPHYARNYWRNILINANSKYLYDLTFQQLDNMNKSIPRDQLVAFLRVVFFNYQQDPKR